MTCRPARLVVAITLLVLVSAGVRSDAQAPPARVGRDARPRGTAQADRAWAAKVDPWVGRAADAQGETEFLVLLDEQADLAGAALLETKAEKGAFVFRALTETAARTQPPLLAHLRSHGLPHQAFWIANMVLVRGNRQAAETIARRADVARVHANPAVRSRVAPISPQAGLRAADAAATAWNIAKVRAPETWAAGVNGQGAVVGGADTGYAWDHPALINQYRGWNGTTANHNYAWHDAIHGAGGDSLVPVDDYGHGTHTMGIAVGNDLAPSDSQWPAGATNAIGVAPGARWIGCRNMLSGVGTPATYTECFQFFLAPTDLSGQNPNPALAPDVINNSWSCPPSEGCTDPSVLQAVVQNVRAAGILPVNSAGNQGPACGTVATPPGHYDASFSVGNTDSSDVIAASSSRGPVTIDGSSRTKPDISAPGVNVRSSVLNGAYATLTGTSMAAPHVAGLAALLVSARPALGGNVAALEQLISGTAVPRTTTQGCGGDSPTAVPNNVYGAGRVDAYAAVQQALTSTALVSASPGATFFGGMVSGGTLQALTAPQTVTVSFSEPTMLAWTATADQPWIHITGGAGGGAGRFTVAVTPPTPSPVSGAWGGTITVTAPGAARPSATVRVTLTLYPAGTTRAPLGYVDAPVPGATGVVGAIGVTGWAVDDIDLAWVRVYRNCLAFEPAANCQTLDGTSVVYVGDATRVEGARPDIEAAFPSYPQKQTAAWGYLLLTNLLPHVPNGVMYGGQGPLTLYVRARDVDGHELWLGRGTAGSEPTPVTLANDTIAKPFGAIDTPAQGATVSGTLANFGWALTPDTNTVAGEAGDIAVPADGSTLRVYIDGSPGPLIGYNQCRGTIAGPVGAGQWCDDDVANIFGRVAPQPPLTPRTTNPTRFRNLDAGRGAIGSLLIDTTTLANGVHTILWGVADSAGRGEGLGSRYFRVLNAGGRAASEPAESSGAPSLAPPAAGDEPYAAPLPEVAPGEVHARTALHPASPFAALEPDAEGVFHVTVPDQGRLELALGRVHDVFLVANGERRPLPPGSRFDATTGRLTWAPGVGYVGTYRLVATRGGVPTEIDVTVGLKTRHRPQ